MTNLIYIGLRGGIFIAIAIAFAVLKGHEPMAWAVIATYGLTGMCFILGGMLMDAREEIARPKKVEVLLRHEVNHEKRAWTLTVFMTATGELYAPDDADLRKLKPIDQGTDLPRDILGCPHYTPLQLAGCKASFHILNKVYSC